VVGTELLMLLPLTVACVLVSTCLVEPTNSDISHGYATFRMVMSWTCESNFLSVSLFIPVYLWILLDTNLEGDLEENHCRCFFITWKNDSLFSLCT